MSAWRLAIRGLEALGGDATTVQIAHAAGLTPKQANEGLASCRLHGLATSTSGLGKTHRSNRWQITELGRGVCADTVRAVNRRPGLREFVAVCPHCGRVPA